MKKNIKKKKIKVPAAQFGLPTSQQNPYVGMNYAGQFGPMSQNASNVRFMNFQAGMAGGNPAAAIQLNGAENMAAVESGMTNTSTSSGGKAMGALNVAGIAQAIPGAINALASPFQQSTATTGGEAAMQSLQDIAGGIGAGAQLGSAIGGPVGGAIGGAAGAIVGAIGKKGKKASMTSFTDYDEGTLNTGLRAAFKGNKKLRAERARIRTNAFQNREGVAGTERLLNEFNENNTEIGTNTFQYGGGVPTSLAYVDDGELIQTPDGSVSKVPEQGQPTDSNLVDLPEGSRVLSNTLKVPGTSKTFAELGDKIMTKRKSKGNDIYAQNADMLNEMNNKMMHDKLFAMQENLKAKKGIKNKSKELIPAAKNGMDVSTGLGDRVVEKIYNPFRSWGSGVQHGYSNQWYHIPTSDNNTNNTSVSNTTRATTNTHKKSNYVLEDDYVENPYDNWTPPTMTKVADPLKTKATPKDLSMSAGEVAADLARRKEWEQAAEKTPFDWTELSSDLASLAPIMSNLFTSDPEAVPVNYNPYAQTITNTMARRKYNIDPVLRDIDTNRAVGDYSLSQQMTNTGHNMAFRLQNAIAANKAKLQARSVESNENNRYKAEYANAMNDLGRQYVSATNLASDLNAQNRATTRNIRRSGISQLSSWAQNRTLMRNQSKRDKAMLELYKPFLEAGFTTDVMNNWNKFLR